MASLFGGNTSTAVMARRVASADSLDFYPTHPWAARALCEEVLPHACAIAQAQGVQAHWQPETQTLLEPACGTGDLLRGLEQYFASAVATDVHDWPAQLREEGTLDCREHGVADCPPGCKVAAKLGWPDGIPALAKSAAPRRFVGDFKPMRLADFLDEDDAFDQVDWVISNPPYNGLLPFLRRALALARVGVAFFVRLQCMEGAQRYRFYHEVPPLLAASFSQRVPLVERRLDSSQESATAYCWVVFLKGWHGMQLLRSPQGGCVLAPDLSLWKRIGPVRDRLIKPADYADWPKPPAPAPLLTAGSAP